MNKPTTLLLLILTLMSCNKTVITINEIDFRGKTFNVHSKSEIDTMVIDFQDSTHQIFGDLWAGKIPWRISHYENTNILVLDNRLIGLRKKNEDSYDCTYIGLTDQLFTMSERKPKWKKEHLYGTWVEEKYIGTDSSDFPPPPIENLKTNWPPSFKITEEKIVFDFYQKSESKIQIPNSGDFIQMNLRNPISYGINDYNWEISHLSDSLMIVIREFVEEKYRKKVNNYEGIRLIKKR